MSPVILRVGSGVSTGATTISRRKSFASRPTALSLGTTWQTWLSQDVALQGTALGASVMAQPAASNGRMNGIITMAPLHRLCSRSVSSLATGPCSISRGVNTMSPGCSLPSLREGKISCERDGLVHLCGSSTAMVSPSGMPRPIEMRAIRSGL